MDQYILSLSYGKDSLACLGAIQELGWPIDRIVHAEVWATDEIPADLPPMVEFKSKADAWIRENFGIEVEHVWAAKRERERERERRTYESVFYERHIKGKHIGELRGFPMQRGPWCNDRLKTSVLDNIRKINVREDILPRASAEGGGIKSTDSRSSGDSGATDFSRGMFSNDYRLPNEMDSVLHRRTQERYPPKITGFPISIRRGNWCTGLKTSVF